MNTRNTAAVHKANRGNVCTNSGIGMFGVAGSHTHENAVLTSVFDAC